MKSFSGKGGVIIVNGLAIFYYAEIGGSRLEILWTLGRVSLSIDRTATEQRTT